MRSSNTRGRRRRRSRRNMSKRNRNRGTAAERCKNMMSRSRSYRKGRSRLTGFP